MFSPTSWKPNDLLASQQDSQLPEFRCRRNSGESHYVKTKVSADMDLADRLEWAVMSLMESPVDQVNFDGAEAAVFVDYGAEGQVDGLVAKL